MSEILKTVLIMSAAGGAAGALLLGIKPITRRVFGPTWQYYIWLVPLIIMCIPPFVEFSAPAAQYDAPSREYRLLAQDAPASDAQQTAAAENIPAAAAGQLPRRKAAVNLGALWLCGAGTMLLYKLGCYVLFARRLRANSRPDGCIFGGRVRLMRTGGTDAPFLTGLFFPTLYLPEGGCTDKYVLRHELTHYKRRDLLYKWFAMAVSCVHWFNPVVHAVIRQVDFDCEAACDYAVTRHMDADGKREYMRAILNTLTTGKRRRALATHTAADKKCLARRFGIIKAQRKIGISAIAVSAVIYAAVLVSGCAASGLVSSVFSDKYDIKLTLGDEVLMLENKPFVENNTLYLPLREMLARENGAISISWQDGYAEFTVPSAKPVYYRGDRYDGWINRVRAGSEYAYIGGHSHGSTENVQLVRAPILADGVMYVPYDTFEKLKSCERIFGELKCEVTARDKSAPPLAGSLYCNEELNFMLELPLDWCGKYSVRADNSGVGFFQQNGLAEHPACMFYVNRWESQVTPEEIEASGNIFLMQNGGRVYELELPQEAPYTGDEPEEVLREWEMMRGYVQSIADSAQPIVKYE